jgi:hypothetical protein
VIVGARLSASHDGTADAAIEIRYPNGAHRTVIFSADALAQALGHRHPHSLDELVGQPWTILASGLTTDHT